MAATSSLLYLADPSHHVGDDPIERLADMLDHSSANAIVLYFHGGLVGLSKGEEAGERISQALGGTGAVTLPVIWETGITDSLLERFDQLTLSKVFAGTIEAVTRAVAATLRGDGGGRGDGGRSGMPGDPLLPDNDDVTAELKKPDPLALFDDRYRQAAESYLPILDGHDTSAIDPLLEGLNNRLEKLGIDRLEMEKELRAPDDDEPLRPQIEADLETQMPGRMFGVELLTLPIVMVAVRTIRRMAEGRDHGLHTTVVEEILRSLQVARAATEIWKGIKDRAERLWSEDPGTEGPSGAALIRALANLHEQRKTTIHLVGHSAGSIAICELLRVAAHRAPGLRFGHVIMWAPACTVDRFAREVTEQQERYEVLSVFNLSDTQERADQLVPGIYHRSLLYFLSGLLENEPAEPLVGLARFHDPTAHENDTNRIAMEVLRQNVIVEAPTGDDAPAGARSDATSHGDFDEDTTTLASLAALLDPGPQ